MEAEKTDKKLLENTSDYAELELFRVGNVLKEREQTHGDASDGHALLGQLWQAFTLKRTKDGLAAREIGVQEAMFMQLLGKIARVINSDIKQEHIEDIIGYASLILGHIERAKTMAEVAKDAYRDAKDGDDDVMGTEDDRSGLGLAATTARKVLDPKADV